MRAKTLETPRTSSHWLVVFPWVKHLDKDEQREFFDELMDAIQKSLKQKNTESLQQVIESWQATAQVKANPKLYAILTRPRAKGKWTPLEDVRAELLGGSRR